MAKKKASKKKPKVEIIVGILSVHPKGFGFVTPENPATYGEDIFIPKHCMDSAVHGDKVEIAINPDSNWEKGPDGKVTAVLKRGRSHMAGTIRLIESETRLIAYAPLLGSEKPLVCQNPQNLPVKIGERVIIKVKQWGDEEESTTGEILYSIGHISDASCDVRAAVEEFDLPKDFSAEAVEEAKKFGKTVSKKDLQKRRDFTKTTTFTIDPETARDFDDALSITVDKQGNFHLTVHIADVAHYVAPGSALDAEAVGRCNSTYFPGSCLPMLPEELSNELCSLKPDVIRLTASVLMSFDKTGTMTGYEITRGYIKSVKRFTYEEAKEVLDGKKKSPYKKDLELMEKLCHLLKKKRRERGSIDFAMSETVIVVDEKGNPTGTKTVEYDITHQLVEEFMLKANETVAKHLADEGKPLLYRIHEEPAPETLEDFYELARTLGFRLPKAPEPEDLQKLFQEGKNTPFAHQLAVGFIRSMKLACYSPDNVGHFGLSLEHYCHFTSPIRRYSDLVIQRILFDGEISQEDLDKIGLKCSEQERISFRAEMSVKTLKKLRLLKIESEKDPAKFFIAPITKVKPFGLYFEVLPIMLEGFLHISELEDDYFVYNPRGFLAGKSSGKIHKVGETLQVRSEKIDLILQEVSWELIGRRKKKRKNR